MTKRRKRPADFAAPTVTRTGEPCKTCVRLGHVCKSHTLEKKTPTKTGTWETAYMRSLALGHSKTAAAALAGVTRRTPLKRAQNDPAFADRQEIAYAQGQAVLEEIAFDRITDPKNPADSVLRHLLAVRGLVATKALEVSGPDGQPIEHVHAHAEVPFDYLSPRLKREILREMRALEEPDEDVQVTPWMEGETIPVKASKVE